MKVPELRIGYIPIDDITPYEKNPRKHTEFDIDKIALSIERSGFNDPIGIWGKRNIIVEGHGRLLAAKKLGMEKVPCIRLDHLTEKERREYAIAHNATAELSAWDFDLLGDELGDLDLSGFEFDFDLFEEGPDENLIESILSVENVMAPYNDTERDTFNITFTFRKEFEQGIKSFIKANGKERICDIVIRECLKNGN